MQVKPAGYTKKKRDEYSPPRMPVVVGRAKICQACYRTKHGHMDHICARCLRDLNALAKLEIEIAKAIPKTGRMTRPQIFAALWRAYLRQKADLKRAMKGFACPG